MALSIYIWYCYSTSCLIAFITQPCLHLLLFNSIQHRTNFVSYITVLQSTIKTHIILHPSINFILQVRGIKLCIKNRFSFQVN